MIERQEGQGPNPKSRAHDLFTAILGGFSAFLLATLPMHIDSKASPYPFYKGPTIFPFIVLSVLVLSSLPSFYRLAKPASGSNWYVDGEGWPRRPVVMVTFLSLFFVIGINLIGVEISVFSFLILSIFYLKYRRVGINLFLPLLYTAVIVTLFKYIFGIYFPKPWIFSLFGG